VQSFFKNLGFWVLITFMVLLIAREATNLPGGKLTEPDYTTFRQQVVEGRVEKAKIIGETEIEGEYKDGGRFRTYIPVPDDELIKLLAANNVKVTGEAPEASRWYVQLFWTLVPAILLIFVLYYLFFRQMQGSGKSVMSFGKSRARLFNENLPKVTFEDVAGCDEAKEELQEIIDFLKDPAKFQKLGGRIPKGVLVKGPPGTGKTLLARAVAGEAGVKFLLISGSDFVEMFVGVGASRVRDLFEQGRKLAPCIIFIDEIDAVGRLRGAGLGGGHDEREQTLNALLVEMDGFETKEGVIMIAATNRPDVLDPALMRPGRFDRQIVVDRPDCEGRKGILTVHARKVKLGADVNLETLAKGTPGFSGADLESLVNEAALLAARRNLESVGMREMEDAKDKVLMGPERRSVLISDEEKRIIAYHEAGHALVAEFLPGADPVHKITIVPRGMALGLTQSLPKEDKYLHPGWYWENQLALLMGGRVAELLEFAQATTGAANDIERASAIARKMVCEWGMSVKMGPLAYGKHDEAVFLGRDLAMQRDYSEATAVKIDEETRRFVDEAVAKARGILEEHRELLDTLAQHLLDREVLTGEDVKRLVRGEELGPVPARPDAESAPAAESAPTHVDITLP